MPTAPNPRENYNNTKNLIGYLPFGSAKPDDYQRLGFKCGLEIHQQLKTKKKLFCRCPAGLYQKKDDYDAEVIRHMRPTLSELGEYDGTALMEFRTRKNITYRIKNESACTYDIDDTPPFALNQEALNIALEVSLLLKSSIVGELHITRKQYLDGSIPTGFQRTGIIGIEGEIPLTNKKIRIIQLSLEEDSCREVSDIGHERIYTTDRLGIPLIETVTYPDMLTPAEAAQAAHYLRFLTRSTDKVRTGIGAAREDVNVSITGGTRVEIKGVAHISWIPRLTHNEAYRQKALLEIQKILKTRIKNPNQWKIHQKPITPEQFNHEIPQLSLTRENNHEIIAVNLPDFAGILSFFTQPGHIFADELSNRLKVIACLEKPHLLHSEELQPTLNNEDLSSIHKLLNSRPQDAQIIFWG
ncbi:MAG: Glu-tRNA(Gln) amidotransferase GatDE subunit E, partial [Planctomycetes bacterium]|nr:Glu-tRNA(Gln) amidotransferase GatDE subunit E [Planctomycetota bacterium]